jgi:hypothetical protein
MSGRALFISSAKAGPELKAGTADCKRIHDLLINPLYGEIDALLSAPMLLDCPSDSDFISKINDFFKSSVGADQRIVYFTGHGLVSDGQYCLVFNGSDVLPFSSVTGLLSGKGPGKTLFILDTCHSGAAELGGMKNDGSLPIAATGSCIFASSKDIQLSQEDQMLGSLFTHYLCECISTGNGGEATSGGLITVPDAATYVKKKFEASSNFHQTPRYSIKNAEGMLWIARNISGSATNKMPAVDPASSPDKHRRPCAGATIKDLDPELVRRYAEKYLAEPTGIFGEFVRKLDLFYTADDERPNEAAILCFGIRPERFFPSSTSAFSAGDRASQSFDRRVVEGPLVRQLDELLQLTMNNLRESAVFGDSALRKDRVEIPRDVMREVISNALAHRNFEANGRVHVHVADDHVEVTNPGKFPEGHTWEELLDHPGPSLTPNRRIANHLQRTSGYEGVGRGFSILKQYRDERGDDAVNFRQLGEIVVCRLKRFNLGLAASGSVRSAAIEAQLAGYVSARSDDLARTPNLLGQSMANSFVGPSLVASSGQPANYEDLLEKLRQPGIRVLLTGAPGSGKSYILRHSANQFAEAFVATAETDQTFSPAIVPIVISLRDFRADLPMLPAIAFSMGVEVALVGYIFQMHRVVIFADGLDEVVPSNRARIVQFLTAIHTDYPKTSMVVSSRPGDGTRESITSDVAFEVGELSDDSVRQFLAKLDEEKAREIEKFLDTAESDFFKNPLLLSLLLQVLDASGALPSDEDTLFEMAIDVLLYRHDAAKGVFRRHRQALFDASEMRRLLGIVALIMVLQEMYAVPRDMFAKVVEQALDLTRLGGSNEHYVSARNAIEDLVGSGLVVESRVGIEFLHRSLMEHLAVRGAVQLPWGAESFAHLLSSILRSNPTPELAVRMARSWVQSPQQCDDLIRALDSPAKSDDPAIRNGIARLIKVIIAEADRLRGRDRDIFEILGKDG